MSGKLNESQIKGNLGEAFANYFFQKNFGWIYRSYSSDIGIDGEVEILEENGKSTSTFIKVQVKARSGNTFRFEKEDLEYWKEIPAPVMLFLYQLKNEEVRCLLLSDDEILKRLKDPSVKLDSVQILEQSHKEKLVQFASSHKNLHEKLKIAEMSLRKSYSFIEVFVNLLFEELKLAKNFAFDDHAKFRGHRDEFYQLMNTYNKIRKTFPWAGQIKTVFDQQVSNLEKELSDLNIQASMPDEG